MRMRICITGTFSVGKTELINSFTKLYPTYTYYVIHEVARTLINKGVQLGQNATLDSYCHYINEQLSSEINSKNHEFDILFADRSMIDAVAHPIVNNKKKQTIPDCFIEMFENILFFQQSFFDLYIYLPIEFPIVPDSIRILDEKYRKNLDDEIQRLLKKHVGGYYILKGSISERCLRLKKIIDSHYLGGN